MTTKRTLAPKKRRITSFEPDVDVAALLDRASAIGIKQGFVINTALRKYLPKRLEVSR